MKNTKLIKAWPDRHLPEELCTEILCRLPVKSLLRFRSVSKSWLSLIDDAEFARLHLKSFKNNCHETHLFIAHGSRGNCAVWCSDTFETISETPPISNGEERWKLVFSVDGLVLLKRIGFAPSRFCELKLWNPSIRKFHEFPSLPHIEVSPDSEFMEFGIGLGYDPVANDYKYVHLFILNGTLRLLAIYTLGTQSWKTIQFQGKECCSWHWDVCKFPWTKKVCLRGSLYMIALDTDSCVWELVSFDMSREVFSSMELPDDSYFTKPSGSYVSSALTLIDSGCSDRSVAMFDDFSSGDISLWVLESSRDEGEPMFWTKRYSFHLSCFHRFLYLKKNGDVLTLRHLFKTLAPDPDDKSLSWELRSHNPETGEFKILEQREDCSYTFTHVSAYVESLIMLEQFRNS